VFAIGGHVIGDARLVVGVYTTMRGHAANPHDYRMTVAPVGYLTRPSIVYRSPGTKVPSGLESAQPSMNACRR
jgi:hypothetical protein